MSKLCLNTYTKLFGKKSDLKNVISKKNNFYMLKNVIKAEEDMKNGAPTYDLDVVISDLIMQFG